jgi:hypothetical protein
LNRSGSEHPIERLSFVNLCLTIDEMFSSPKTRRKLTRKCVKAAVMHSCETVLFRLRNGECVFGLDCASVSRCSKTHYSMVAVDQTTGNLPVLH